MSHRFYAPDVRHPGQLVALPEDEAVHLTRVLRLKAGDAIRVFDGAGHEFAAIVEQAARHAVAVRVGDPHTAVTEAGVALTLAQALLKGDKMDDVVRDAVMMGVAEVLPLLTSRTEVSRAAVVRAGRQERWQRIAVVSAKQCGRARVPRVLEPVDFTGLLAGLASGTQRGPALMFVEPQAHDAVESLTTVTVPPEGVATILIGPEGGWSPDEIAQARGIARLITLRRPTLRADAMPIVAMTALLARWGAL